MKVVALISWIVTALAGATLFGIWVARGGLREQGEAASRFPRPLILGHPILAATGLIIWIIDVATDTDVLRCWPSPPWSWSCSPPSASATSWSLFHIGLMRWQGRSCRNGTETQVGHTGA